MARGEPLATLRTRMCARVLVLVAATVLGQGCADVVATADAGGRAPARDADDTDPTICHVSTTAETGPPGAAAPEVLILLDRSSSMDTAFAASTRRQVVTALLSDLVETYGGHVRFAYQELPGRQACSAQPLTECCASPPLVSGQTSTPQSILSALAAAGPADGATPTAAALRAALTYFAASLAGGDRYVLLATDGTPTCTLAGSLATGFTPEDPACADALAEVQALAAASVRVLVLGIGPELTGATAGGAACLDRLAQAGGAAASPGSPGYYTVENGEQLQRAMERTFGAVTRPPCVLEFPVPLKEGGGITVYLDRQRIPQTNSNGNGWVPDPPAPERPKRVRVVGQYCQQIQTFQVSEVVAYFKCPAPDE